MAYLDQDALGYAYEDDNGDMQFEEVDEQTLREYPRRPATRGLPARSYCGATGGAVGGRGGLYGRYLEGGGHPGWLCALRGGCVRPTPHRSWTARHGRSRVLSSLPGVLAPQMATSLRPESGTASDITAPVRSDAILVAKICAERPLSSVISAPPLRSIHVEATSPRRPGAAADGECFLSWISGSLVADAVIRVDAPLHRVRCLPDATFRVRPMFEVEPRDCEIEGTLAGYGKPSTT